VALRLVSFEVIGELRIGMGQLVDIDVYAS